MTAFAAFAAFRAAARERCERCLDEASPALRSHENPSNNIGDRP
jgi:hypothetical protein